MHLSLQHRDPPSLLPPQTSISTVSSFFPSFHCCHATEKRPLYPSISALILPISLYFFLSSVYLPTSLSLTSSRPLSPPSLSPRYSAVKASSVVFQKIKPLSLSLYRSLSSPPTYLLLSPLLSECLREMQH